MSQDTITFKCAHCGSKSFSYPGSGKPKPDDVLTCSGCGATGRYADIQAEMVKKSADVMEQAVRDALKKAGFK